MVVMSKDDLRVVENGGAFALFKGSLTPRAELIWTPLVVQVSTTCPGPRAGSNCGVVCTTMASGGYFRVKRPPRPSPAMAAAYDAMDDRARATATATLREDALAHPARCAHCRGAVSRNAAVDQTGTATMMSLAQTVLEARRRVLTACRAFLAFSHENGSALNSLPDVGQDTSGRDASGRGIGGGIRIVPDIAGWVPGDTPAHILVAEIQERGRRKSRGTRTMPIQCLQDQPLQAHEGGSVIARFITAATPLCVALAEHQSAVDDLERLLRGRRLRVEAQPGRRICHLDALFREVASLDTAIHWHTDPLFGIVRRPQRQHTRKMLAAQAHPDEVMLTLRGRKTPFPLTRCSLVTQAVTQAATQVETQGEAGEAI